jgi:asparaginyl-tRNA synthetase
MTIKKLFSLYLQKKHKQLDKKEITIKGIVKSNRCSGKIGFIEFRDGSSLNNLQCVYKYDNQKFQLIKNIKGNTALIIKGIIFLTELDYQKQKLKQPFELQIKSVSLINKNKKRFDIIQKKFLTLDFLRKHFHLRIKTKTFWSIFKIKNELFFAISQFFQKNNFFNVHTSIFTTNDTEGAGETFSIKKKNNKEFFSKKVKLSVSGQLQQEALCQSMARVYTLGPVFRADESDTFKHISEFWMLEAEISFFNLKLIIKFVEKLIKYIFNYLLKNCQNELLFLSEKNKEDLILKLKTALETKFIIYSYDQVIEILKEAKSNGFSFTSNQEIKWGMELQSEHEKYICDRFTLKPTFIINYPKKQKAFYMKSMNDKKRVKAFDLLFPFIGEIVGGSERENDYQQLLKNAEENNLDLNCLKWYLNLRLQSDYINTSGFGLGIDRLLMYITGIKNIRDVVYFPVWKNHIFY